MKDEKLIQKKKNWYRRRRWNVPYVPGSRRCARYAVPIIIIQLYLKLILRSATCV